MLEEFQYTDQLHQYHHRLHCYKHHHHINITEIIIVISVKIMATLNFSGLSYFASLHNRISPKKREDIYAISINHISLLMEGYISQGKFLNIALSV